MVIKDHLANHRFRAAFHQLGVHFHIGLGGHHNVQLIVEQVSSSTWDGQEDILSHISEVQVLVDEMYGLYHWKSYTIGNGSFLVFNLYSKIWQPLL